jgi:single-strand DNA-binding protein
MPPARETERYMPPPSAGPGPGPGAPRKEPAPGGGAGLGDDFDDDIPFARPAALDGLVFPNDGAWFGNGAMFPYKRK